MRDRGIHLLCAVLAVLTGCRSVQLATYPPQASVTLEDGTRLMTPCEIRLSWSGKRQVTLSKRHYETQTLELTATSGQCPIPLSQRIAVSSEPSGAMVLRGEAELGTTPLSILVPATTDALELRLRHEGCLEERVPLSRTDGLLPDKVAVRLAADGAGRQAPLLAFDGHTGFPLFRLVRNDDRRLTGEASSDGGVCAYAFGAGEYPLGLWGAGENLGSLLVSVVTVAPPGSRRRYFGHLAEFRLSDGTLTALTSGRQIELSGDVLDGSLCYLSLRTGRLDLWRRALADGVEGESSLLFTHRLVKRDVRACGAQSSLSFTGFLAGEPQQSRVWVLKVREESVPELRMLCHGERASWAPGGRSLAYQVRDRQSGGRHRIGRIESDGSQMRPLAQASGEHEDVEPSWSPDGRWVVFASDRAGGGDGLHDIWAVSEDGKEVRRLTSSASSDRSPCFSPDGRRVYFMSNRGLRWGLWWVPFGE